MTYGKPDFYVRAQFPSPECNLDELFYIIEIEEDFERHNPFVDKKYEDEKEAEWAVKHFENEYIWSQDRSEFVEKYIPCLNCGGSEEWCDCCQTYTQICCVPYGTCQCS